MPNLLVVEASPRFEFSASRALTKAFVDKWKAANPDGAVTYRDLPRSNIPFVDMAWIGGAFTPYEDHSSDHSAAIRISDDLIAELQHADHVVIGTPMHNFSISALLKAYLDQIVRSGVTVSQTYEGMLKGKTATLIVATGGDFSPGAPYESANSATGYLRQVLGFVGITDVTVILGVKTLGIDAGKTSMAEYVADYDGELAAAVAAHPILLAA
jgi:FMN-dependent NADH-azoreductase